MAKFLTAKFESRAAVMARLNAMLPEAEKQLATAQLEAGEDLAEAIRGRAPVRTGKYRDSINAARLADKPPGRRPPRTKDKNAVGIYAHFRWRWLEFGTVKTRAQPHVLPTYRGMKKRIYYKMAEAVGGAILKARAK